MLKITIASIAILANSATAETPQNIQNHEVQKAYFSAPCIHVVATLDAPSDYGADLETATRVLTNKMITWGHLLGFESAHPGIRGEHETILKRLRAECAKAPQKTSMELLNRFVQDL
ncbi:hypothetical protein [Pelagimonas varians]|uniref:Rap1a immunity protein domain-containing protein n=1 Tax=Pelagimonas varians TaxID=696760 RepID=A0A238JYW1_9RHOB|nr:hypothetical protein [Pelagimonas varians]PYG33105.1 hypothetical protein C8N36_102100 [Pelagimonas varians]SMX35693.1 hypothetical protein PEV8663_00562 [Pelagimonas varians]